jgi:hypothetical protein
VEEVGTGEINPLTTFFHVDPHRTALGREVQGGMDKDHSQSGDEMVTEG